MDKRSTPQSGSVDKVKTPQSHYASLLAFILFALGALFLSGIGLLLGVAALASFMTGAEVPSQQTVLPVAFGFEGIVLLAAAFFSFQKFLLRPSMDAEASISISNRQIAVLVLAAGASLLIGYLIRGMTTINWIVLPVLTIPGVVFPLAVLLAFGTRKLPFGTRWQTWSVLGFSMTLAPFLLFALEVLVAIIIFVIVLAYIITQPELALPLQRLSQQIMILGPESEATRELLAPFLTRPEVIAIALIYVAMLVPAIEEIFKPIGVWLFAGQLDSPAQGLTLGALSGAGYALIETVGVSTQTSDWASLLASRIGTGLLHITTSALMGAAIVMAWRDRRYLRLVGTYFLAVLLHGLWNSLAVFFSFSTLAEFLGQAGPLSTIQAAMITAMIFLAAVLFAILVIANLRMRVGVSPRLAEPTVSGEDKPDNETM